MGFIAIAGLLVNIRAGYQTPALSVCGMHNWSPYGKSEDQSEPIKIPPFENCEGTGIF
jgi:hypothetical protein